MLSCQSLHIAGTDGTAQRIANATDDRRSFHTHRCICDDNWSWRDHVAGTLKKHPGCRRQDGGGEKELAEYKTQVAKEYASMRHLKEVEERLVKAMDHLSDTISDMPQKIFDLFNAAPVSSKRGRSV